MKKLIKTPIKRVLSLALPHVEWHKAVAIVRACNLTKVRIATLTLIYYLGSTLGALLDGAGLILLVELVAGEFRMTTGAVRNPAVSFLLDLLPIEKGLVPVYLAALLLFLLRAFVLLFVHVLDGYLQAKTRQVIQKKGITAILHGDWEYLRGIRVGQKVGAITEEALHVAQFFMAILRTMQGLLLATVMSLMAISVSIPSAIIFVLVGIPASLTLKHLFGQQSKLSEKLIAERQGFYASVTERLSGLFQLKVEDRLDTHLDHALAFQKRLTGLEIKIWVLRAWVVFSNAVVPALVLLLFYLASLLTGEPLKDLLYLLAGVGALGLRVLGYVNVATGNISSLTSVSGSLGPVYEVLTIPRQTIKQTIPEKITGVRTRNLAYSYARRKVLTEVNLDADLASPLVIKGSSGSGKTTLANLLAGLYEPGEGSVIYLGTSGACYDSREYRPRAGYVTQDIHLFHDTIRNNLRSTESAVSDDELWEQLARVGAREFVQRTGGLDVVLAEGGRSLSGGEKRRIGIARVLVRKPDILILDEVTSGLDDRIKRELEKTIEELSHSIVVVVITHEPMYIENHTSFTIPDNT
ncbi:MAG: ABC transporter ATP-binding protein [Candidatus Eisenbacteria sp.]|nr:ABC transporter ATP-binding protein [Candidatus Eisenbacteria bacterium]